MKQVRKIKFKNEPELRRPFDENFAVFFPNLELVRHECELDDVRLDVLAFDKGAKSFVIIEYKLDATKSDIFAQGLSYHDKLQRHKADCIELLSEKKGRNVARSEIAWQKTRLIFVSAHFTKHQIRANSDKPPIDLLLVRKYPNYLVVSKPDVSDDESPAPPPPHLEYSEADWLAGKYGPKPLPQTRDLYFVLKNALIAQFQLEHLQRKKWASFRLNGVEVCSVVLQKHKLRIVYSTFKKGLLPLNDFIDDVSKVGKLGRGNYRSDIETESDARRAVEYVARVCQDVSGSRVDSEPPTKSRPTAPVYSETDWLEGKCGGPKITPHTRSLYNDLKRCLHRALTLDHVQKKKWASLRLKEGAEVCSIILHQRRLEIVYATSKKSLWPPNDFVADISHVGHHGKGDYRSYIETESDIQRVMKYVEIVYKDITGSGPRYA